MWNIISFLFRYFLYRRDPIAFLRKKGMKIGENCRLLCGMTAFGSEPYLIEMGDHVTITSSVAFITHDGGVWVFREQEPEIDVFGRIIIGNNVFIGLRSIIMPNVKIGNNCVIGAGSVVTKDIPDNSIAVGVPARVVNNLSNYREKIRPMESHIRNLPYEKKKSLLMETFSKTS